MILEFILDILYTIIAVIGIFGFLQLFDIYKNYREDIKVWPPLPTKTYHQVIFPIENNNSIEEMEMFFRSLHAMYDMDSRNQVNFEIHSKAGKINFYLISNDTIFSLIRSSLEARFPGVNFINVEDPFKDLDDKWTTKHTKYTDFKCAEFVYNFAEIDGIKVSNDLLPSLSWRSIQRDANAPTSDPVNLALSSMEELVDGEYAIFQISFRGKSLDSKEEKKYKTELDKVKTQLATNSVTDQSGSALTDEEKKILNEIQRKRNSDLYAVKIRYGYFLERNDIKPKVPWISIPISYLKQFGTPYQSFTIFTPYSYLGDNTYPILHYLNYFEPKKVSTEFNEKKYTTMKQSTIDPYLSMLDLKSNLEGYYRKKQFYVALLNREFKYGAKVMNMDVDSLACLVHFPITNEKNNVVSKLQNLANETSTQNPASWSTPPANLPF
jgi:hypothetical protein